MVWTKVLYIRRSIFLLALAMAFIFASLAHASTPADDLGQLLNSVQSMKANFTQTTYNNKGKATQKSFGRMAMQRPGRFRWDVTKPMPQLIIANQSKLWIYDPDLEQVTIRSLKNATGETPALLLSHEDKTLGTHFIIKALPLDAKQRRWFSLSPQKKSDEMFVAIKMGFLNHQIQEMRLQDNLGHETVIQFQHIQQNLPLPSSLFIFKPTAKIDVIDETRKK